MIDIHCHILPGLDDGAQRIEDSLAMARLAAQEGIRKIVATPHHMTSRYENPKQFVLEKVKEVNTELRANGIPVEVLPGQEIRIFGELLDDEERGLILPVNQSPYCLIEFPSNHVPSYAERLFYDMQMKGLIPVIVHPERNSQFIEQPDKLFVFVEKGTLTQVTAGSIVGKLGKKIQKFSLSLIEANLTHFLASDAHNTTTRPFYMAEAYSVIEKQYGMDYVYLFRENAELVIQGKTIYKETPEKIKRKRIWRLFSHMI